MKVDEPVHLEQYCEAWPALFKDEEKSIKTRTGASIVAIEHFGSTSVPGMPAKPIIDLLIGVDDMQRTDDTVQQLYGIGYEMLGEAGIPGRLYLRKRSGPSYNVHITLFNGDIWNNNLSIRNYLRANPMEAERYGALKKRIVDSGTHTLLAYSDEKNEYIKNLQQRAISWSKHNWTAGE